MNLVALLDEQVVRHPGKIALFAGGRGICYAELQQRSAALAARLSAGGLRQGDAALPVLDVGIPLYIALLALFRLGAVVVVPERAGLDGLRTAAGSIAIRALVGDWRRHVVRQFLPAFRGTRIVTSPHAILSGPAPPAVELPADAPALITFTSGSTGRPKAIVRSHGFLLEQHRQVGALLQSAEDDVALISLPMFILCNLALGVTSVIPDGDLRYPAACDPRPLLRQIERHRVNRLVLPPAMCERLAESGAMLTGITQIFTGGGPVFPDLLERLSRLAPQARITAVYGSSEAEPIAHVSLQDISAADLAAMRHGAGLLAGRPVDGLGLRIEDDEIWVSGSHVVKGYLNPADDSASKRMIGGTIWHRTGDAGRLDEHGRLWLLGRHEARCGSLFPFAVETAARCMRGVRNAALVNVGGSAVLAVEPDKTVAAHFAQDWSRRWAGDLRVVVVPGIPMDRRHNSKVDYGRLRALLQRRGPGQSPL